MPGWYLSAKQHATPVNKKHFRLARSGSSASKEVASLCDGDTFSGEQLNLMLQQREWREGFPR